MVLYPLFPITNQFQNKNGSNLVAGILRVYYASRTDILPNTYKDQAGSAKNPQDIILDNNGRATVYVDPGFAYNLFVYDSNENLLWTEYNFFPENVVNVTVNGLQFVEHDETLSGTGREDDPLKVNTDKIAAKSYVDSQDSYIINTVNGAVRNLGNEINGLKLSKQDKLTPGENVEISEDNVISFTGGGGGGSGDNNKVAAQSGATPNYLNQVLVPDTDEIVLTPVGNQLRLGVNLTGESDPKLATMGEIDINSATSNYGNYALTPAFEKLVWNDTGWNSYQWLNAVVYMSTRLSDAQGTVTKCNVGICGSLAMVSPLPCCNVGIFDMEGNLLGMTGLKFYGTDFTSETQLCSWNILEMSSGSLKLKRNTRYIVQLWSCGIQFAAHDRGESYNYTYDYGLRQNVTSTISQPVFKPVTSEEIWSPTKIIPFISFGASDLSTGG